MQRERRLVAALLVAVALGTARAEHVVAVDGVQLTTPDLPRAVRFYTEVLTFRREERDDRHARLRLGDAALVLVAGPHAPPPPASRDRAFQHVAIVVRDMASAWTRVSPHVTAISAGPQRLPDWNVAAAGIEAVYFRDPDGHPLELIAFPPDKGSDRWRRPGPDLFLGIDHTALVVADTGASLAFWRDRLGLRAVGGSENHGIEQERLAGVPGVRVRITTLRPPRGIGVELLHWVAPPPGAAPDDDVAATATIAAVDDDGAAPRTRLRDPDGHAVLLDQATHEIVRTETTTP